MSNVKPMDNKRSGHWPAFRKAFLKGKSCAVCGGKTKLEAHHIMPFHLDQSLELSEANLIALCEGTRWLNCHLAIGHLGNFKGLNPSVKDDAALIAKRLVEAKAALKRAKLR